MKKRLFGMAVIVFSAMGSTYAQSTTTMYGIVDAGIVSERGGRAGSVLKVSSGVGNGSRLGFKEKEDLGGGLSAEMLLEAGLLIDTGASAQGGLLFGREAFVGVSAPYGTVRLGRQLTPYYSALYLADPFATGSAGSIANIMSTAGTRMNNTVKYVSPIFGNFRGELAYGFGEVAGDNSASRAIGGNLFYENGPATIAIGYHNLNNATATDSTRNTVLTGMYDFGVVKGYGAYAVNRGPEAVDSADAMIGISIPVGQHRILASYINHNDKTSTDRDAHQWAIGYNYFLSNRTDIYTSYGSITNKNGATFTVGNATEVGSGDRAYNVGIRHRF